MVSSYPDIPPPRRELRCGASDGFSVCTEPPGHGPVHYDRATDHEWTDEGWLDDGA